MKLPFLVALLLAAAFGTCPAKPPFTPGQEPVVPAPVGRLGYHIGTYLTIEGVRAERGKVGTRTLVVDRINNDTLAEPVGMWIDNVELPEGVRCVLKGYETGRWIGIPAGVLAATGGPPSQAEWQFRFSFLATSIEKPPGLTLMQP